MADELKAANHDLSALRIRREDAPRGGRTALVAAVVVALGALGWLVWRQATGASRLPAVETALVRRVSASDSGAILSASGYLLPERKANVSSKAFGRLEWIGVDVGSHVKKDQIIARLAAADVAARLEEAKAALAEAERELVRWEGLLEKGAGERERVDRQKTLVELARARVKSADADLEYTNIRAPFDGVVVRKNAEAGETVGPSGGSGSGSSGGSICTLVDPSSLEMVADVNEANIGKIRAGQQAEVVADAHPDKRHRGEVRQIVPTADRQKGIVQVKVRLLQLDATLLPEMAARATFLREGTAASAAKRVMAPRAAVRERGGRRQVLVLEGTRVRAVAVETGVEGEDGIEITSGLSGGEVVVIGGDPVEDGADVRVAEKK